LTDADVWAYTMFCLLFKCVCTYKGKGLMCNAPVFPVR